MKDQRSEKNPLVQLTNASEAGDERWSPFYELREQEVWFSEETKRDHRRLKASLWHYVRHSRFFVALTAPFIYACIVPFLVLDLFVTTYQAFSFPIYAIPKVVRGDYIVFDRGKLCYLNALERLNCAYCSYANGLMAYVVEVAGRTEQHWCPVKHARRIRAPHSRYSHFLPYGDAGAYREKIEDVRQDFRDLRQRERSAVDR